MEMPIRRKLVDIKFACLQEVDDLIADLRQAKKLAKRTGGTRDVVRKNPDGSGVHFVIECPHVECVK